MLEAPGRHNVRNAARFGSGVIISRVLGLARDIVLTFVLGGGWAADIFFAAFRIPNLMRRLVYEGSAAMAFLPFFNRIKQNAGKDEAYAFGRTALWQGAGVMLAIAMLCAYGANAVAMLLAPGFADVPRLIDMTSDLVEISFFYLPLLAVYATLGSMLLSMEKYFMPAMSAAFLNVSVILTGLYAIITNAGGYEAARIFCYGILIGGILQTIMLTPQLYGDGFRFFGHMSVHSPEIKSYSRKAPQTMFGSAAYQLGALVSMFMASFLGEGNVTALYLAERILELPLALVGVTLGTASIASFSRLVIERQTDELKAQMRQILALGLCFSLPAAFGAMALAWPIMGSFFNYGNFTEGSLTLAARALIFYAPLLPAVVIGRPLLAALNAGGRAATTMLIAMLSLLVLILSAILLLRFLRLEAIAISASLGAWTNTLLLGLLFRRCKIFRTAENSGFFPWKRLCVYLAFSLLMFGALAAFQLAAEGLGWGHIPRVLAGVPLGGGLYLLMCRAVRSPELELVISSLRK